MKKLLLVSFIISIVFICSGCGAKEQLFVYNAADYIDANVIKNFEKQYNINVTYNTYDSNEEMYNRLTDNPGLYDVVFSSDYMISRMIKEDMLTPLDMAQINNFSLIDDKYKGLHFDTANRYSVAYMTGTLGILYNESMVTAPIDSWASLWDVGNSGKILMLNSERDAIAAGLKASGFGLNSKDPQQIDIAENKLKTQKRFVKWYQTDEIKDNLASGRAAVALTYSGEAYNSIVSSKAGNLKYVIPKEGSNKWVDSMVVPKSSKNFNAAMKFINYICQTDSAVLNQVTTGYTSVQKDVRAQLPPDMQNSPIMYPPKQVLDICEYYDYDIVASGLYQKAWMQVKAFK